MLGIQGIEIDNLQDNSNKICTYQIFSKVKWEYSNESYKYIYCIYDFLFLGSRQARMVWHQMKSHVFVFCKSTVRSRFEFQFRNLNSITTLNFEQSSKMDIILFKSLLRFMSVESQNHVSYALSFYNLQVPKCWELILIFCVRPKDDFTKWRSSFGVAQNTWVRPKHFANSKKTRHKTEFSILWLKFSIWNFNLEWTLV